MRLLVLSMLLMSACALSNPHLQQAKKEFNNWKHLAEKHDNSYVYTAEFGSFSGFSWQTTVEVSQGNVISRSYTSYIYNFEEQKDSLLESWTEIGMQIGRHDNGAKGLSMEEIYTQCIQRLNDVDKSENDIFFETDTSSAIQMCGYVPHGCADDCYQGISISEFKWADE